MSPQVRINAMISYFFLGWLMLLSKNPEWNDPFVRSHAKTATMIHAGGLLVFFLYAFILNDFLIWTIPLLNISLSTVIVILFFCAFFGLIITYAYRAYNGLSPSYTVGNISLPSSGKGLESVKTLDETERIIILSSYLPFLGIIIGSHYPNRFTAMGVKVGGFFTLMIILAHVIGGASSTSSLILSFLYIAVIVTVGVWMFLYNSLINLPFLNAIPSVDTVLMYVRASAGYVLAFLPIIFGREKKIEFALFLTREKRQEGEKTPLFLPSWLIGIPGVNLVFLPILLLGKSGNWKTAILQGVLLDMLIIFVLWWRGAGSAWMLLFLFPICRMIALFPRDPEARIPVLYEILVFLNSLTLGFLSGKKHVDSKSETVTYEYTNTGDKK